MQILIETIVGFINGPLTKATEAFAAKCHYEGAAMVRAAAFLDRANTMADKLEPFMDVVIPTATAQILKEAEQKNKVPEHTVKETKDYVEHSFTR